MEIGRSLRMAAVSAACAVLLAGCSMPRLLYGQADWLLLREVDHYLELREEQREEVARALEAHLERHRAEQLPLAAEALAQAAERARRGLTHGDARWLVERVRSLARASVEPALPTLAAALADLTPRQRAHLARRMEERNRDYAERHALDASPAQRVRRRAERLVERIEYWTGPLDREQVALVHELRARMPDSSAAWLAYTRDRQQALLALAARGAPAARIEALLRGWWLRLDAMPAPLAAMRDRQVDALARLLVRLDATLDSTQREHLVGRLRSLSEDARHLAREA